MAIGNDTLDISYHSSTVLLDDFLFSITTYVYGKNDTKSYRSVNAATIYGTTVVPSVDCSCSMWDTLPVVVVKVFYLDFGCE